MSKAPYPRKQTAQYKTPAFYWRGGDTLREREYLADEYKKALADYRRADYDLKQVEDELSEASETLHEREGYTTALANYLDADTEGNQTEQECKRRLIELEAEIKEAEVELQEARAVHHPAIASSLQKEKAYLMIEMQRTQKALELANEQQNDEKRKLAQICIGQRYQTALDLETKLMEMRRKAQFLRSLVNRNKNEFDNTRPVPAVQTAEARAERNALGTLIDANYSLSRADEKTKRRPAKWSNEMERLFGEMEELNHRMYELGMDEDAVVDVEALRQKYAEEGGEEEPRAQDDAE